jgi:predicted nucleotidyltransferase
MLWISVKVGSVRRVVKAQLLNVYVFIHVAGGGRGVNCEVMPALAIEIDTDKVRGFCRRWNIAEFALFGSVTRPDDFGPDSDIDVLVRFAPDAPLSLEAWVEMRKELAAMFGRNVDLVERTGVEWMRNYLRRQAILESAVLLDVA